MLYDLINTAHPEPGHPVFSRHQYRTHIDNKGLLLFYGTGTGKTRAALRIAESYITDRPCIIVTGRNIFENWRQEMVRGSSCGRAPFYFNHTNRNMKTVRRHVLTKICSMRPGKFYFMGYLKFCSKYAQDNSIYDNALIICDEAHRMTGTTKSHKTLRAVAARDNDALMLMLTASPCYGEPYSIADLLNVLLLNNGSSKNNIENQEHSNNKDRVSELPARDAFLARLFGPEYNGYSRATVSNKLTPATTMHPCPDLAMACQRHVSTVFQWTSREKASVREEPQGRRMFEGLDAIGYPCVVAKDTLQWRVYRKHVKRIIGANYQITSVVNTQTLRNICFGVFPDGSYGKHGSLRHFDDKGTLKPSAQGFLEEFHYDHIGQYSAKIKEILRIILEELYSGSSSWIMGRHTGKMFVYCPRIYGMIDMLVLALNANGFAQWGQEGVFSRRGCYAIINGRCKQAETQRVIGAWNNRTSNRHGETINVLIATEVVREGITLLDTTHSVSMEPDWNNDNIMQVNSRSVRPNALEDAESHRCIKTYTLVAEFEKSSMNIENPKQLPRIFSESDVKNSKQVPRLDAENPKQLPRGFSESGNDTEISIEKIILRYAWIKHIMAQHIVRYVWMHSRDFLDHHCYNVRQHTCDIRFSHTVMDNAPMGDCEHAMMRRVAIESKPNAPMLLDAYAEMVYEGLVERASAQSWNQCNRLEVTDYDRPKTIRQIAAYASKHFDGLQCVIGHRLYRIRVGSKVTYECHEVPLTYELHYKWAMSHEHQLVASTLKAIPEKHPIDLRVRNRGQEKYAHSFKKLPDANGEYIAFIESTVPYSDDYDEPITAKTFKLITPTRVTKKRKHCDMININSVNSGRYVENYKTYELMGFVRDILGKEAFDKLDITNQKATWIQCLIEIYQNAEK